MKLLVLAIILFGITSFAQAPSPTPEASPSPSASPSPTPRKPIFTPEMTIQQKIDAAKAYLECLNNHVNCK